MAFKARITSIPVPLFTFDDLFEYDNAEERGLLLTNRRNLQSGLENTYQARTQGHTDAHQLHPGGPFYPEQSPPLNRATMSGGLGLSADDLHHFDQLDESPGLSSRYQRPRVEDPNHGASA
jgi:hypothetical protein